MQLKKYSNYRIDFRSKALSASCTFMGLSAFMRAVHYLGIYGLNNHHIGTIIFSIFLPLAGAAAYIYLLKFHQLNAPGIYGFIGAGFCLVALLGSLFSGNILRIILSIPWYPAAALVLMATVSGNMPDSLLSALLFTCPIAFRLVLVLFGGGITGLTEWLTDAASLAAFASLPYALIDTRRK